MKVSIDPREIEKAIAEEAKSSSAVRSELDEFVEEVAETVRSLAPVDTGKFRNSIKARKSGRLNGIDKGSGVQVGEVYSDDPAAPFIEHGTGDTPAHAPFLRTAFRYGGTGE
ncbi:HK97 gp10 family phage protein [Mycolicibacterium celeriflavum]|uniref:Uncharacterized protein n=1 Tax=Mycolicibacterium celeriflavum TaxID=1249101 RepID=A0A1X0C2J6_MYCCF|nr:HK97 gp10 family phage protein [Mycolicibacterium celeriflavum]MCV7239553.1 HK97 gp10 family phage protein [Mycolicibacterium celeriflavum]ORA51616.1 hypothetical protein BST21_00585 [Mycolicibacterium celeriflavum]BBY43245.1 hypothetical protein MCEL_15400 [Mycolicibacterium celeriflavum]